MEAQGSRAKGPSHSDPAEQRKACLSTSLPRGQCRPGPAVWRLRTPEGDSTGHLQGKRENKAPGGGRKGSWAGRRQEAQGTSPRVRLEQSGGLGTMHGPATSPSLARQCGIGRPLPPPSAPSQGPHVEGGLLHQAKAVMSREEGKLGWEGGEGGRRGEADTQKAQDCSSHSGPGSEPALRLFWGHGPPLSF